MPRENRRAPVAHGRGGDGRLRRFLPARGVGQEDDLRVDERLEARSHLVVDRKARGDRTDRPATSFEHGSGDDVVQLRVGQPDPLRGFALERRRHRRDRPHVARVGKRPVGACERDPVRPDRDEKRGAGARGLFPLQRVERGRGVALRHHRDDPGVVRDDRERPVQIAVPVLLERLPRPARLLQVLVDLCVRDRPGPRRRYGNRAADGDQDEQRRREEDLEGEGESRGLGRRELEAGDDRWRRRRSPGRALSSAHRPIPTAANTPCRTCSCAGWVGKRTCRWKW